MANKPNILMIVGIIFFLAIFIGLIIWLIISLTKKNPATTTGPPQTTTAPPQTTRSPTTGPPQTTRSPTTTRAPTTTIPPTVTNDTTLANDAAIKGNTLASSLNNKYISLLSDRSQKYCSDTDIGVVCQGIAPYNAEKFLVNDLGNGIIALQGGRLNKYCTDMGDKIICNSDNIGADQKFKLVHYSDSGNVIALRRAAPEWNKYCSDINTVPGIVCNSNVSDLAITFKYQIQQKRCADYNGQDVKCASNSDIYRIQDGKKHLYTSIGAFESITGANISSVNTINCDILNSCPIGDEYKGSLQYQASECERIGKFWSAIEQTCRDQPVSSETAEQACINRRGRWVNGQCYRMS